MRCISSFIKSQLGGPSPSDYDALIAERDTLRQQVEEQQQRIAELEAKVWNRAEPSVLANAPVECAFQCVGACAGAECRCALVLEGLCECNVHVHSWCCVGQPPLFERT